MAAWQAVRAAVAILGLTMSLVTCGEDRLLPLEELADDERQLEPPVRCAGGACEVVGRGAEPPCGRMIHVDSAVAAVSGSVLWLWPPNGELRHVPLSDCVQPLDGCGEALQLRLLSVTADEWPDEGTLDIAHVGCASVDLRARRKGAEDGRTYTVHFEASDAAGSSAEGVCYVVAPHDSDFLLVTSNPPVYEVLAPAECL